MATTEAPVRPEAHYATRVDLAKVEGVLSGQFVALAAQIPYLATKEDLAQLRSDLNGAINTMTWKLVGVMLAGLTALGAFLKLT